MYKCLRNTRKYVEKELPASLAPLQESADALDAKQAAATVDACLTKLQQLKRKLQENQKEEKEVVGRCKKRLDHLNALTEMTSTDQEAYIQWTETRLNRMLAEHFLRRGFHDTAKQWIDRHSLNVSRILSSLNSFLLSLNSGLYRRRSLLCCQTN
jgi:macrophage erythroblast attacher